MPLPPLSAPQMKIPPGGEPPAQGRVHVISNARFDGEVEWFLHSITGYFRRAPNTATLVGRRVLARRDAELAVQLHHEHHTVLPALS